MSAARTKTPSITKVILVVLCIVVVFPIASIISYFGFGIFGSGGRQTIDHENFARSGVSQIQPAAEMEELFDDCRHYIVSERDSGITWNTTAYFGERYELTMRVPVYIKSKGSGSMIGDPKFYLREVDSVSISSSGGVRASFSEEFKFDEAQWKQVYDSGADFSSVGFTVNTRPVPNFQTYADACRQ